MNEKVIKVPNISCSHCTATIEREVGEMPGVVSVKAEVDSKQVTIQFDSPAVWVDIENLLDEIGYPAQE